MVKVRMRRSSVAFVASNLALGRSRGPEAPESVVWFGIPNCGMGATVFQRAAHGRRQTLSYGQYITGA